MGLVRADAYLQSLHCIVFTVNENVGVVNATYEQNFINTFNSDWCNCTWRFFIHTVSANSNNQQTLVTPPPHTHTHTHTHRAQARTHTHTQTRTHKHTHTHPRPPTHPPTTHPPTHHPSTHPPSDHPPTHQPPTQPHTHTHTHTHTHAHSHTHRNTNTHTHTHTKKVLHRPVRSEWLQNLSGYFVYAVCFCNCISVLLYLPLH